MQGGRGGLGGWMRGSPGAGAPRAEQGAGVQPCQQPRQGGGRLLCELRGERPALRCLFWKRRRYARVQSLAVGVFALFATIWVITRNGIFPFVLIRR